MAADPSDWVDIAGGVVFAFFFTVAGVAACGMLISQCTNEFKEWWRSRRMRLFRLGGATTLRRTLNDPCAICQDSMEVGEKVRTLSCNHVFHCGGTVKCERGIDHWLLDGGEAMAWKSCPFCGEVPRRVLPWKRPPPSSPAPSPSPSASTSMLDLEEPLLPPAPDETTLPEKASSSAPAPPLAQSPLDLEEGLPLPEDDEILQDASSSQ